MHTPDYKDYLVNRMLNFSLNENIIPQASHRGKRKNIRTVPKFANLENVYPPKARGGYTTGGVSAPAPPGRSNIVAYGLRLGRGGHIGTRGKKMIRDFPVIVHFLFMDRHCATRKNASRFVSNSACDSHG